MKCLYPRQIQIPGMLHIKNHGLMTVPCGKCIACLKQKSREWSIRMLHEFDSWDMATFLTLTYNNESLPLNTSIDMEKFNGTKGHLAPLVKEDLQLFFKRLRKLFKIKYYACGEYGDIKNSHRPHYHAIVFGISNDEHTKKTISALWGKGLVHLGTVTDKSCMYVTKYINKKQTNLKSQKQFNALGLTMPFQIVSQELGLNYAIKNYIQIIQNQYLTCKGKKQSIPRYYIKKLLLLLVSSKQYSQEQKLELRKQLIAQGYDTPFKRQLKMDKMNKQMEINIKSKEAIHDSKKSKL